jgi:hypothetical protein
VRRERLVAVGTNSSFDVRWQSPDLPSPTLMTAPGKPGGGGWLLVEVVDEPETLVHVHSIAPPQPRAV